MKEKGLRNNLRQVRIRQGMSQQELAGLSGVTRQTISGVESDLYAPSAAVALRIARALGCRVEDLFWLEDEAAEVDAVAAAETPAGQRLRLAVARVGGRWIAYPLVGESAFRTELIPADGEGTLAAGTSDFRVRLLDDPESLAQTVVVAGCSPALSLWAQAVQRWNPGIRVHTLFANSMNGLHRLARGEVHAAGLHLFDPESGQHNVPFVRQVMQDRVTLLINLGVWEEGLLVQPGNPLGLRRGADLAQPGVSIVNREPGAGSRMLLERLLQQDRVPCEAVRGFDRVRCGHVEVAQEVAAGWVDAAVSTASVAAAYGLDFVPLQEVRYDMAVPKEYLEEAPVRQLFASLNHRRVRSQLEALGGYNTALTGEIMATVEPHT